MSNEILLIAALLTAALAITSLISIPWLLAAKKKDAGSEDLWRDKSNGLVKLMRPILRIYSHHAEGKIGTEKLKKFKLKLNAAGLNYLLTPAEFIVMKRVTVIIAVLFAAFVIWLLRLNDLLTIISIIVFLAVLGYLYPDIWINDQVKFRQKQIEKTFPFFLDLLALTMRAGLPFAGAVQLSATKMTEGPLKHELNRYQRDIRTGMNRSEALEYFAERINLSSITNFVAAIIQAEESGGSITRVLGEQARQRRKERFLRAEKKANEAPVKMLIPLVGLLFPITFIIIAIPIVVQFMQSGMLESILK